MESGPLPEISSQYLPLETQFQIYIRADYESLLNFCRTRETYALRICGDDYFWELKTRYDFEDVIEDFSSYTSTLRQESENWFEVYQDLRQKVSKDLIDDVFNDDDNTKIDQIRKILEMQKVRKFLDINYKSSDGTTLLIEAARKDGYIDVIADLLELGADPSLEYAGENALMIASRENNANSVKELLKDPIVRDIVNQTNDEDETALIIAAKVGDAKEIVDELVNARADVNARDEEGKTALFWAYQNKDWDVAKFLLDN